MVRGEGGRGSSGRGDKGDETQCSFKEVRGDLNGGVMNVKPSSGMWERSEDQPKPEAGQKEWSQPSEEALGGRGWGAEANSEKWARHKWTTRRLNGTSVPLIEQSEQSETTIFRCGEKPSARE